MIAWENYTETESVSMNAGFPLYLRKGCEYSRKRFVYRVAEVKELTFLEQFDFSNLVCLDVGANIGYWTIYLSKKLGAKKVYGFEPDPILFSILKKNLTLNEVESVVFPNQCAIGQDENELILYHCPENSGDNRPYFVDGRSSVSVPCTTIDDYAEKNNIARVDFIKMDIQGGEANALQGAINVLQRDRPVLMVEFSSAVAPDGGKALKKWMEYFLEQDMSLSAVRDNKLQPVNISELEDYEGNIFVAVQNSWLMSS